MMKVAVLDMYNDTRNLGIKHILKIINRFEELEVTVYNVRGKCEIPSLDYDIYIHSGGPGSPLEGDGMWDRAYYYFLGKLWKHNQRSANKKYAFFICHSFQMAFQFLSLGSLILRRRPSLGIYPMHITDEGEFEEIFHGLPDPFYAADFRKWQVIRPDMKRIARLGCKILAREKVRDHVPLERAIMAVRFSPEWIGTQFHPEAEPKGMLLHFEQPEEQKEILEHKGMAKFHNMIEIAKDPTKLQVTHDTILPTFLRQSIEKLEQIASLKLTN